MAARGLQVVGIDFSPAMIERARARADHLGLAGRAAFTEGSLESLPFATGAVSGIVCAGVIEYFPDPRPVLAELVRVLRPGGALIVTFNNVLSPVRWLWRPALALRARLLKRPPPTFTNHAYTTRSASRLLAGAGLTVQHWRRHTFAIQLTRSLWLPPPPLARRLEVLSRVPLWRSLAWGLIAVCRRERDLAAGT
jgi:SAM-dependent methyltransferase